MRADLPTVLRVNTEVVPAFVVMADAGVAEGIERTREKVAESRSGGLTIERKQTVTEDAEGRILAGTDVSRPELHLVATLDQTEVVADLVGGGGDEPGRSEPAGAAEVASDVDVGVIRQWLVNVLDANAARRQDRDLKFCDAHAVGRRAERVQCVRTKNVSVAKYDRIHLVVGAGVQHGEFRPGETRRHQAVGDVISP